MCWIAELSKPLVPPKILSDGLSITAWAPASTVVSVHLRPQSQPGAVMDEHATPFPLHHSACQRVTCSPLQHEVLRLVSHWLLIGHGCPLCRCVTVSHLGGLLYPGRVSHCPQELSLQKAWVVERKMNVGSLRRLAASLEPVVELRFLDSLLRREGDPRLMLMWIVGAVVVLAEELHWRCSQL